MPAEQVAREHYRTQQALATTTARVAAQAWQQVDPDRIVASWREASPRVTVAITGAQRAAAGQADGYLTAVLAEQGIGTDADGEVEPSAFSGIASDGRELETLVRQPANLAVTALRRGERLPRALAAGQASLDMIARTQVADAGRTADQVSLVAHRSASGYIRLLVPPSCSRCAILAGRWYRYSAGFQRHPRCKSRATAGTSPPPRTSVGICAPTRGRTSTPCPARSRTGSSPRQGRRRYVTAPTWARWSTLAAVCTQPMGGG